MLVFVKQQVKVVHVNTRLEKHGEEEVLACDVKMMCDVHNSFLDKLKPGLREALYERAPQSDIEDDHLIALRFPTMSGFDWDEEIEDGVLTIHGHKKSEDVAYGADFGKVKLSCMDGGSVIVTFTAQLLPTPEEVGVLAGLLGTKVKVSVIKPEEEGGGAPDSTE